MAMPFRAAAAWCCAELDHTDEARAILEELRPQGFAAVPRDHTWVITMTFLSRVCARLGDTDTARELYDLLLPCRFEIVTIHAACSGPVVYELGLLATMLGHYEDADAHFSAAAEVLQRIGSPAWLAWIRLAWGRMLLTRRLSGDTERAQRLLGQALATARELTLGDLERRVVALL